MAAFLVIVSVSLVAFCFSFMLLDETHAGNYASLSTAWFTSYVMLLGEVDSAEWHEAYFLQAMLFHVFTIFSNIVLLNVLIAIISDTYERVQESAKARGLMARGRLLLEFQDMMNDSQLRTVSWFPKWLHAIMRVGDLDDEDQPWFGRVVAMKRQVHQEVEATRKTIKEETANLRAESKADTDGVLAQVKALQSLMVVLSNKIDGVQVKVSEAGTVHVEDEAKPKRMSTENVRASLTAKFATMGAKALHKASEPKGGHHAAAPAPAPPPEPTGIAALGTSGHAGGHGFAALVKAAAVENKSHTELPPPAPVPVTTPAKSGSPAPKKAGGFSGMLSGKKKPDKSYDA